MPLHTSEQHVPLVQEMMAGWPHGVDVVVDVQGDEQTLPAEQYIALALGDWLGAALAGTEPRFAFLRAVRRLPEGEA